MIVSMLFGWGTSLALTIKDLLSSRDRAQNLTEPFKSIASDVIPAEIRANFDQGGRPNRWPPLSEDTGLQKAKYGFDQRPLIRTGVLLEEATSVNNWTFDKMDATLTLPEDAAYGAYHIEGTEHFPARDFTYVPDDAMDKIDETVIKWVTDGD